MISKSKIFLLFLQCLVLWTVVVPLAILLPLLPISILLFYRLSVTILLRRIFRPDLIAPLTSIDYGFSSDDFHGNQRGAVGKLCEVKGLLDKERVLKEIQLELHAFPGDCSRLTSVYPTFWLGYPFWTRVPNQFKATNHLKVATTKNVKADLHAWFDSPFQTGQPLWDVLLIPGYTDDQGNVKSLVAARVHHMVADGISWQYFFHARPVDKIPESEPALPPKVPIVAKISALFWTPLVMWNLLYTTSFSLDALAYRDRGTGCVRRTVTVKLADLKKLRQLTTRQLGEHVSFLNVVLLCLSGAIRRVYLNDLTHDKNSLAQIRLGINISSPTPLTTVHPAMTKERSMCNHWGFIIVNMPIGQENPSARLKHLVDQESWVKLSMSFETNLILPTTLCPLMPSWIFSKLVSSAARGVSSGISNFPQTTASTQFCGHEVSNGWLLLGLQAKQTAMAVGITTYQEVVTISAGLNDAVFPKHISDSKLLQVYFVQEMNSLLAEFNREEKTEQKKCR